MTPARLVTLLCVAVLCGCAALPEPQPLVIAHRGASGYLPEHTIAAKAMAYAQGADYIEQDLVMTKDDEVVVLHDHHLDTVTDVRERFPERARADGRYYVIDFTLGELRELEVSERFAERDGNRVAVYEDRFPLQHRRFVSTHWPKKSNWSRDSTSPPGGTVGIYPEIKSPAFHRDEGKDISVAVLSILKDYGYTTKQHAVLLQCFDPYELQRIHDELQPSMAMEVRLVQLLGTGPEFKPAMTSEDWRKLLNSPMASGHRCCCCNRRRDRFQCAQRLAERAHNLGLVVHAYTFRRDQLPYFAKDYEHLLDSSSTTSVSMACSPTFPI